MKFNASRTNLHGALARVAKAVESRNTIPILSNVLLEASADGTLSVTGTDLDLVVKATVPAAVDTPGALTVSAQAFSSMVSKLSLNGGVSVERSGHEIKLSSGRLKSTFQTLPASDFPDIGGLSEESKSFTVSAKALYSLISSVDACISTEENRYYLCGIYLHSSTVAGEATLRAVATDGHKLARCDIDAPDGSDGIPGVIVPKKAVTLLKAMTEKSAGDISVSVSRNKIQFGFDDGVVLTTKVIDGTFPDYQRVIPTGNDKIVRVDREAFAGALDRVSSVATAGAGVKLSIANGQMLLVARGSDGSASDEIEVDYEGDDIEVGFNARYLASHISTLGADTITLALADPGAPALMMDKDGASTLLVIMPVRI